MTYFDRDYLNIWRDFQDGRLSMSKRESALEPRRQDLYATQFPKKRAVRRMKRDDSMSRAEMLEWQAEVDAAVAERRAVRRSR